MRRMYYGLVQTSIVWHILFYGYIFHGPITHITR